MIISFIVWSIVAIIFLGIGISCRKSKETIVLFTFAEPPKVRDIKQYNNAVSKLWFAAAGVLELLGIPFLFLEQKFPECFSIMLGVVILLLVMIIAYFNIEKKYRIR